MQKTRQYEGLLWSTLTPRLVAGQSFCLFSRICVMAVNPCCSLRAAGQLWTWSCMHSTSLQVEACSSLQRCFVTELFMVSTFTGWLGKSQLSPRDTQQGPGEEAVGGGKGELQWAVLLQRQGAAIPLFCHVYNHLYLTADTALFPFSPTSAEQAQHLAGPWDPMQTCMWHCIGVLSHTWSWTSRDR